jgi:hypothetical protein
VIAPSGGDMEFSLVWNTMSNPETESGLNLEASADQNETETSAMGAGWLDKLKRWIKRG